MSAVDPEPVCAKCGGQLTWCVEYTALFPNGNGYDVQVCEDCGAEAGRHWAGF